MAIDVKTQGTPGWWLNRLAKKREAEHKDLQALWDRYEGKGPLPSVPAGMSDAAKTFYKKTRLNMAELIVGLVLERMKVRAIRTDSNQDGSDELAWAMFTANDGHIFWADGCEKALVMGKAHLMVGLPPGVNPSQGLSAEDVQITVEDPRQVVTIQDPVRKSVTRAAAKFYHDPEFGVDHGYLYMNGKVWHATRERKSSRAALRFDPQSWSWVAPDVDVDGENLPDGSEGAVLREGYTGVPVRRMRNKSGVGEFERHTDLLDRIDHMILQRMVIATMQAFRQRAIKGDLPSVYPPEHPKAGQEIDYDALFQSDPGALWLIPGTAEMWESNQVDLSGILNALKDDIRNLAAVTRRALPAVAPEGQNQSAEGASLAREGQTFATEDRELRFGQDLAWAISLGLELIGDTERSKRGKVTVDWMPVDRYPMISKAQAAAQAKAAGMSKRFIMEHIWQLDPAEVNRENAATLQDLMLTAPLGEPPAPAAAGGVTR